MPTPEGPRPTYLGIELEPCRYCKTPAKACFIGVGGGLVLIECATCGHRGPPRLGLAAALSGWRDANRCGTAATAVSEQLRDT